MAHHNRPWGHPVSAPDRRAGNSQLADLRVIVAQHIGSCTELNKIADQRHAENLGRMDRMDGKLDKLIKAAEEKDAAVRFMKRVSGWVGGAATAVAGTWAFLEHAWPALSKIITRQAVVLLLAGSALAHDDDEFMRSLTSPTGASCCSMRDCSLTDDWDLRAGVYVVRADGGWREVPDEVVLRGQQPHPSGRAVMCIHPAGHWLCFLPGSPQT